MFILGFVVSSLPCMYFDTNPKLVCKLCDNLYLKALSFEGQFQMCSWASCWKLVAAVVFNSLLCLWKWPLGSTLLQDKLVFSYHILLQVIQVTYLQQFAYRTMICADYLSDGRFNVSVHAYFLINCSKKYPTIPSYEK